MKKLLAVLIAVVMLFSFAAVPVSATLEDAPVGDTTVAPENFLTDIIARIKAFVASFREMIHELIGGILDLVDKECPFCDQIHRTIIEVDTESFADALANAEKGDTLVLAAGDYGAVELGTLKDVQIDAQEGANIVYTTTAETVLEDVVLKGINAYIPDNSAASGFRINAEATIENLVIADSTFTGSGVKSGRAIYGQNPTATITITNCTFENIGYPIYTMTAGGYADLTVDGCTFKGIKSWCVMAQYNDYLGDLTVTNCSFTDCTGGLVKAGAFTEGHTFTFANNTIVNSTEHPAKDWFTINTAAGAFAIVEGNTRDGVEWIPGAGENLK